MDTVRTALFVDFDNVLGGLLQLDPAAALAFAEKPGEWLDRLANIHPEHGQRRWLVRRCYMNPSGSVPNPSPTSDKQRLYFPRFRPYFTQAGFEVIDCPPLTVRNKNAADVRMALDAMDALNGPTFYDEFVVASGDADFTPLLIRLRAADRRTAVVSPSNAAEAFTAIADLVVTGEDVLALLDQDDAGARQQPDAEQEGLGDDEAAQPAGQGAEDRLGEFGERVSQRYVSADQPLNLASLEHALRRDMGDLVPQTNWFGKGGFTNAVRALDLPDARLSAEYLWDASRHQDPSRASDLALSVPEPVRRLASVTKMPLLSSETWPHVYVALAEYAATQEYALTQATRWPRDYLDERDIHVGRNAFGFIVRGLAFGGTPLHRKPSPTAEQIGTAFLRSLLERGPGSQVELTRSEIEEIASYLGVTDSSGLRDVG